MFALNRLVSIGLRRSGTVNTFKPIYHTPSKVLLPSTPSVHFATRTKVPLHQMRFHNRNQQQKKRKLKKMSPRRSLKKNDRKW